MAALLTIRTAIFMTEPLAAIQTPAAWLSPPIRSALAAIRTGSNGSKPAPSMTARACRPGR